MQLVTLQVQMSRGKGHVYVCITYCMFEIPRFSHSINVTFLENSLEIFQQLIFPYFIYLIPKILLNLQMENSTVSFQNVTMDLFSHTCRGIIDIPLHLSFHFPIIYFFLIYTQSQSSHVRACAYIYLYTSIAQPHDGIED